MDSQYSQTRAKTLLKFQRLLNQYPEEVEAACEKLNYDLKDLTTQLESQSKSPVESRYMRDVSHNEERQLTQILSLLSSLNIEESTLITTSKISQSPESTNRQFHTTPRQLIEFSYSKEQRKHERSLKALRNIKKLRQEHDQWAKNQMKKLQNREEKLRKDKRKREIEQQKHTEKLNQKRLKALQQKREIEASFSKKCKEIEVKLNRNVDRLIEKPRVRSIDRPVTSANTENVKELIEAFNNKMNNKVHLHQRYLSQRSSSIKRHTDLVDHTFKESVKRDEMRKEELLRKAVAKSFESHSKLANKNRLCSTSAERMRQSLEKSFNRYSKTTEKNTQVIKQKLKNLEQKDRNREISQKKLSLSLRNSRLERIKRNNQRRNEQNEKFKTIREEFFDFKDRVIEKHKRMSDMAEELKAFKDDIADKKRNNSLKVQRIRTAFSNVKH